MSTSILIGNAIVGKKRDSTKGINIYGVEWDINNSSTIISRIGNMDLHRSLPIQSSMRGCIHQKGKIQYYLHPDNWDLKEDGTPSRLDGYDGEIGIEICKFYLWSEEDGDKRRVWISRKKPNSFAVEFPHMILSADRSIRLNTVPENMGYLSTLPVNSLVCVKNTSYYCRGGSNNASYDAYFETDPLRSSLGKPSTYSPRSTMRIYARKTDSELLNYIYYKCLYWLYVIEYANFNSQASYNEELTNEGFRQGGLGVGVSNWNSERWNTYNNYQPLTPIGYTNDLGNHTGIKALTWPAFSDTYSTAITSYVNRYRGIQNFFGDIWTNVDGVIIKYNSDKALSEVYGTSNPEFYGDTETHIANMELLGHQCGSGIIKYFDLGTKAEIIPRTIGGSYTTYKADYSYSNSSSVLRTLIFGGRARDGSGAGLAYFYSSGGVSYSNAYVGFRHLYRI